MTEQKYPAGTVEAMADALASHEYDGYLERCECREAWTPEHQAVAALDAAGLTVTEEWGMKHPRSIAIYYDDEAHMRSDRASRSDSKEWSVVHRTVLHAETDWEVVTDE